MSGSKIKERRNLRSSLLPVATGSPTSELLDGIVSESGPGESYAGPALEHESRAEVLADVRGRLAGYNAHPLSAFANSTGIRFERSQLIIELTLPSWYAWQHVPLAIDAETLPQNLAIVYRRQVKYADQLPQKFDWQIESGDGHPVQRPTVITAAVL